VKSKVAGNIKSLKKAKTRSIVTKANSSAKVSEPAPYGDTSPMKQTSASTTNVSRQRAQSGKAAPSAPKNYKSKLANN